MGITQNYDILFALCAQKNKNITFDKLLVCSVGKKTFNSLSREKGEGGLGLRLSMQLILINSIRDTNMCKVTVSYSIRPLGAGG